MASRGWISACLFIVFFSFKPSDPHLTVYLVHSKHLSEEDVNSKVYPVSTYAYLPLLLLAGLATGTFLCVCKTLFT